MSRRRSKDPTTDIRITIPRSVLDAIHDEIEPSASRSRWISNACRDKLLGSGSTDLDGASNMQLLTLLVNRGAISLELYSIVKAGKKFISSNPSEEV